MAVRKCLVYATILMLGIFHVIVCLKYEHKLGLLIAFPMIFELVLLYSGIQGYEQYLSKKKQNMKLNARKKICWYT